MSAWEERAGGNGLRGNALSAPLKSVRFIVKYSQLFTPGKCLCYVRVMGSDGEGVHKIRETDKHTGVG